MQQVATRRLDEQRLLRPEVITNLAREHAGILSDIGLRRASEPALAKQPTRHLEDHATRLPARGIPHSSRAVVIRTPRPPSHSCGMKIKLGVRLVAHDDE